LQARMLKISAGNEEFGLGGKWLLHGFKIAKLNLQGNPRLMQRSQILKSYQLIKNGPKSASDLCIRSG
jgi:hypothetical protein